MATTGEFLQHILECLKDLSDIRTRKMMGEYVVYYKDKVIGDICDNRFLIKVTKSSEILCKNFSKEPPYNGAKNMILIENPENREFISKVINNMYDELPFPKSKNTQKHKTK